MMTKQLYGAIASQLVVIDSWRLQLLHPEFFFHNIFPLFVFFRGGGIAGSIEFRNTTRKVN